MGKILTIRAKNNACIRYTVIMGGVCLLMSQKALSGALFNNIIHPYVGTELIYDANLFRLPNNPTPTPVANLLTNGSFSPSTRDSFIKQIKAGVATKWQISQQQFLADVSVNQNWYSSFSTLDYTGYDLRGQWNWQLTQRLKGELSYSNLLKLGGFQQINGNVNNLTNTENYVANGFYEMVPDWYLHTGFTRNSTLYKGLARQRSNLIEDTKEFGFRYRNLLENRLGFYVTLTDGKYPNRTIPALNDVSDNAYTRVTYNLSGAWNYSVKTRIRGTIGYTSQEFAHLTSRNFSDIVANGDIFWQPTSKSSLFLEAWRRISVADNLIASFSLFQGIRLTPTWTWSETPKVQLELPMTYEQQTYLGATGFNSQVSGIIGNNEANPANQSTVRLNLNYTPITNVQTTAYVMYETRRTTNDPQNSYQDHSLGLTMKVSF